MPKSDNQKLKIFYILDYLQRNSHQDHPVRAAELLTMLDQQHNIVCAIWICAEFILVKKLQRTLNILLLL